MTLYAPDRERDRDGFILFGREIEQRKELFPAEVVSHPAKMVMAMVKDTVGYLTRDGRLPISGTILDPFGGTGTTGMAALWGYRVILCELEDMYYELLWRVKQNWVDNHGLNPEMLTLLHGDSKQLLKAVGSETVDLVLTSPPYANLKVGKEKTEFTGILAERKAQMREYGSDKASPLNFGRLNTFVFNQAMRDIYTQVRRILTPDGVYVSVTKDAMRAGERLTLAEDVKFWAAKGGLVPTREHFRYKVQGGLLTNVMRSKGAEVVENEDVVLYQKG